MLIKYKNNGFTIIELLVVIVVIGILATITIVSFSGINARAVSASLQSDLVNASTQLKMFHVEHSNYPITIDCGQPDSTTNKCIKTSSGNSFGSSYTYNNSSNPQTYSLIASNGSSVYHVTSSSGPTAGNPPTSASGGTVSDLNGYRTHTFTTSGTLSVNNGGNVDILINGAGGGGGQGGSYNTPCRTAGGAGGNSSLVNSGLSYIAYGGGGGGDTCGESDGSDGSPGSTSHPVAFTPTIDQVGGGAAFGAGSCNYYCGGSGASGGKLAGVISLVSGSSVPVTVGAGGTSAVGVGTSGSVTIGYSF